MEVVRTAAAGTMESSDVMVIAEPGGASIEIELSSVVEKQFGDAIRRAIREAADSIGVRRAKIQVIDKGALDCVIRARVKTALLRAAQTETAAPAEMTDQVKAQAEMTVRGNTAARIRMDRESGGVDETT